MWFITKLLDTNANHNYTFKGFYFRADVIYHEITWYECKSQPEFSDKRLSLRCDLSRNYLIRMQITTRSIPYECSVMMWFITKLLDTNANHNSWRARKPRYSDVIYHEITWYECKSQRGSMCRLVSVWCDLSRNYLIRMQITTCDGI